MDVYLDKVKHSQKNVLYRLLQYSLFEESENDQNEMNEKAVFEYKYFNNYFKDNDRHAYFIREKQTNKLLGFAMVNSYVQKEKHGHSIAEFLVIPKYRRNGIGKKIAFELFNMFLGHWEVKPSNNSQKAYLFWKNTIEQYTNKNCKFTDGFFVFTR